MNLVRTVSRFAALGGLAAASIALSATLAACSSRTQAPSTLTGLFTIAQQREPGSLNPALENGTSSTQWGTLLFQYLVKYDDSGRLIGDAAVAPPTPENGGVSRDGLTITYHLRSGLRFTDGARLTAHDCVWSILAIQNPANNVQTRYGYDRIVRADAPNATTLVLHLKEPFAPLVTLVLAPQGFPILPEHLLDKEPNFNHSAFSDHPIGSGPYVVTRWQRGDRVEMRANPLYWQGRPRIANLTIRFVPDANTAINLLRTHEVDGLFNDEDLGNYLQLQSIPGTRVSNTPVNGVGAIIFNTQDPLTSDPRVRRALIEAVDLKAVVQKTYHGAFEAHEAGRGLFIWAFDPAAYSDVAYDPKAAAALLDSAGWKLGPDGVRAKNGQPLELLFIIQAQTPGDQVVGNQVAAYERAIGARVSLKQFSVEQFVLPANLGGPVYGGHFQLALYPFVNGDDPDTTDQFACSHVPPNGYNKSRFCDPRADGLLAAGRGTYEVAARKAIYAQLQRMLYAQLPIALLYQERQIDVFSTRLQGQSTSLSGTFWNVGRWTLSR